MLLTIFASLLLIVLAGMVYGVVSVNVEAGREDKVVSVPTIAEDVGGFMRALAGATGRQVITGNAITLYQNGVEIFPALLEAIGAARESVHFSTFVYDSGQIPQAFADAFSAAARRGVSVRIVLDRRGSAGIPRELIAQMRSAGCDVRWFRALQWFSWANYNHRTHRKLLIVDGTVAFTGGVGIADEWDGTADSPAHWRDTHLRILGPAVASVQAAFVDNWNEATGELPIGEKYFPILAPEGEIEVCAVQSNPAHATSDAQRSMAVLIAGASRRLWITNAYFVPTPPFVRALCAAKSRGVDVKILLPGPYHNQPAVRRASRHTWPALLEGNVELYEYQRTMIHCKIVIADSEVTSVGSINFDPRSFALNAEFGIVALDRHIADQTELAFRDDLTFSRRVGEEDLRLLSPWQRLLDVCCYWIRAQL